MILFIIGALLFVGLVLVHEWGHFIAARKNGVKVEEFGLGFPPRARSLGKKNGTEYTLNWLPLGGFVRLKGEYDSDTSKGSFGAASLNAKALIMVAGVGMNLVVAYLLFTVVALIGMPNLVPNQFTVASDTKIVRDYENKDSVNVGEVLPGSPAEKAGFKVDDRIVRINGTDVKTTEGLSATTKQFAGKEVDITLKRGDETSVKHVKLNESSPNLGVASYPGQTGIQLRRSTWSAPIVAAGVTKDFTVATFKGLGSALKGLGSLIAGGVTGNKEARQAGQTSASSQVAGPIGIVQVLYEGSKIGVGFMLFIIAVISLTLAIMNVLPIPALDGGRLYTMLAFRAARKKLTRKTEERIQMTGMGVLLTLILLVTIVDVQRVIDLGRLF
jgi:regulator of sigma E protease